MKVSWGETGARASQAVTTLVFTGLGLGRCGHREILLLCLHHGLRSGQQCLYLVKLSSSPYLHSV